MLFLYFEITFLPTKIVVFLQVRSRFNYGDFDGAEESSESAKKFVNLGIIVGIILFLVYIASVIVTQTLATLQ